MSSDRSSSALVYAHRGSTERAPENTLRAFSDALALGADGVEFDVRQCATGELVVCHDPSLRRLFGVDQEVHRATWAELRRLRVQGERLSLLEDALDLVLAGGAHANVEIKVDRTSPAVLARRLVVSLHRLTSVHQGRVVVSSFSVRFCRLFRNGGRLPAVALLLGKRGSGPIRRRWGSRFGRTQGVHLEDSLAERRVIARSRAQGLFVNVWGVNEGARARVLNEQGVNGLITDRVREVTRALESARSLPRGARRE